jgi:hypothetical protein
MSPKRMVIVNNVLFVVLALAAIPLAILRIMDMTMAITFVLVLLVAGIFMGFLGKPSSRFKTDERVRRINSRAAALSYSITQIGICALYLLDHYKVFNISSAQILLGLVIFMPYSFLLIAFILRRFGDIKE